MNIYVASSWRNDRQPEVVEALKRGGYQVYDFRHPGEDDNGFHWSEIDPNWKDWTPAEYRMFLNHDLAREGFEKDMKALKRCDIVVAVQPFGRSASLELGWAVGAGRHTVLLLNSGEPELMVKMCSKICCTLEEVLDHLDELRDEMAEAAAEVLGS